MSENPFLGDVHIFEERMMEYLKEIFGGNPLEEEVLYAVKDGGKRLRPMLCLYVYDTSGRERKEIYAFATALEWVHSYSLIHDDLPAMDNDLIRRGKPSLHVAYGEATAILTGDALLNGAAELLFQYGRENPCLIRAGSGLFHASGVQGMIGGQSLDIAGISSINSVEDILRMYEKKTGALFHGAVMGGALLSGASESDLFHWEEFAKAFGRGFQIFDDIDDYEEDRRKGKLALSTYLTIDELQSFLEREIRVMRKSLEGINGDTSLLQQWLEYYLEV